MPFKCETEESHWRCLDQKKNHLILNEKAKQATDKKH